MEIMSNLVRKYKLYKHLDVPMEFLEMEAIEYIHYWFNDLVRFVHPEYPKCVFYFKKSGEYVLEDASRYRYLYIRGEIIDILSKKYLLEDNIIVDILKFIIEEIFKTQVKNPCSSSRNYLEIEILFKESLIENI